jgi:hypothetical protein
VTISSDFRKILPHYFALWRFYLNRQLLEALLSIGIGFNADLDPAFLVNADPDAVLDPDPGF